MNITKKIVASIVGLAMVVMVAPGVAQGVISDTCRADIATCTSAELTEYIAELTATVNALNARLTALTGAPAVGVPAACTGITFTANLRLGSTGAAVKCLQAFLNTDAATQVAATGAGSPGNETTYFGPLTKAAVVKFQAKYAPEILTPIGLTAGTGFVGSMTRAKLNALLVAAPPEEEEEEAAEEEEVVEEEEVAVPEEGELTFKLLGVPSDATIVRAEQSNDAVMAFELKAIDSDITVKRIDLRSDGTQKRPAKNLSQVSLYAGDSLLLGVSADEFTKPSGETYFRYRYNINLKVPKGTTKTLTFEVSALANVASEAYRFTIPADGIRYVDTAGVANYVTGGSRIFTMAGAVTGQLTNSLSLDTPAEGIVIGSETAATENVELLRFNLKATLDAVGVDTIVVQATTSASAAGATTSPSALISSVKLYEGTTLLGSETLGAGAATATTSFSDLGLVIAKDTTKILNIKVDLNEIDGTNATSGIGFLIGVNSVTGEDSSFNTVTAGAATGETQYVYLAGPKITLVSASIEKVLNASNQTTHGDGTISFKVVALGGDIVIPDTGVTSTAATTTAAATTTITGQEYTIGGVSLSAATAAQRTITKDSEKTITAKARVSCTAGARVRLTVSDLSWTAVNTFNVPASLLEDLVTPTVLID